MERSGVWHIRVLDGKRVGEGMDYDSISSEEVDWLEKTFTEEESVSVLMSLMGIMLWDLKL